MSYAVVHMEKIKSHVLKGMQFHHQRERESRTNFDIDESRSHENYDLVNDEPIDFTKRVQEIIESKKTGSRKIRKDAVLVNELLVTSDAAFFEGLSEAEQRTFFAESLAIFKERYGADNIAYAMVHVDEKTPHMHVGVVPMRDGRLQSKNVFNRAELIWIQDNFANEMNKHGFQLERGEKGSDREHIEMQKFKKMTLQQQVEKLEQKLLEKQEIEQELAEKKSELKAFSERISSNVEVHVLREEVRTKVKTKWVGPDEVTKKKTGNYVLEPTEIKKVNKVLADASRVRHEFDRLLSTDIVAQNHRLLREMKELKEQNGQLAKENEYLRSENHSLRSEMAYLMSEIESIYAATKSFLKERINDSGRFKEVFRSFVSEVKEYFTNGEFEKLHKKEQARERNRGMER